uniref:Uncharacterized protein n=1 Tax=Kwoniella pini CBS 10737 TaxID=1296096 RepID=A0A1B9HV52_9TREE|nr:uncharacterized protein I206_06916 [Kwoniella pini CBS 10737]OCF47138.1 hypothetical protein I206_06916 [Kwoniella pini CBS 10737]
MISSLPSSHQTRWALDILVITLCVVSIAVSAPPSMSKEDMYTGMPGDVRGLIVAQASAGLIGTCVMCLLRLFTMILPHIWAHYLDRLGFTFVALMWICWTSATMSFTLYTIDSSLCQYSTTDFEFDLPTCPILTFDLTFLHILSTITFCQVLNYLSIALTSHEDEDKINKNGSSGDGFIMWELAINSNPSSPTLQPRTLRRHDVEPLSSSSMGYGSTATTSTANPAIIQVEEHIPESDLSSSSHDENESLVQARDKFSRGRLWTYIPLNLCSLLVACASFASIRVGEFTSSGIFVMVVSFFGIFLLITHFAQKKAELDMEHTTYRDHGRLRKDRVLEVGLAAMLFIVWPISAILYTLSPPTPYQPCSNPSSSAMPAPGEDYTVDPFPLCQLGITVVTLSWVGSWLLLSRIMGLIFPITAVKIILPRQGSAGISGHLEENRALLNTPSPIKPNKPKDRKEKKQKGWQRVTAGEEFELGSDDDE